MPPRPRARRILPRGTTPTRRPAVALACAASRVSIRPAAPVARLHVLCTRGIGFCAAFTVAATHATCRLVLNAVVDVCTAREPIMHALDVPPRSPSIEHPATFGAVLASTVAGSCDWHEVGTPEPVPHAGLLVNGDRWHAVAGRRCDPCLACGSDHPRNGQRPG